MLPLYEGLYDGMIPVRDNSDYFNSQRIAVLEVLQTMTRDFESGIVALKARD